MWLISTQQLDRTRTGWPTLFIIIFYLYLSIYPIYQSRVYRARFHNLEEPLRETNLASLSISALIYQSRPFRNL